MSFSKNLFFYSFGWRFTPHKFLSGPFHSFQLIELRTTRKQTKPSEAEAKGKKYSHCSRHRSSQFQRLRQKRLKNFDTLES
jgi:hypothetical protein